MKRPPLTLGHYCGFAVVALISFIAFTALFTGNKALAIDIIVETDLSGLFFFTGAVIAVASRKHLFSHRYAQMALWAGLGMAVIHFFLKGIHEAIQGSEVLFMIGHTLSICFYGLLIILVLGTYLSFSLPEEDQSKSLSEER